MKKHQLFFILTGSIVLFCTCKKKELPKDTEENEPQFYFNGIINGNQIDYKAGVNNYYMYSSFNQTTAGLYQFVAELKPTACTSCNNSIKIEINDHRISNPNGTSGSDSAFSFIYYPVLSGSPLPNKHSAQFYSLFNKFSQNYLWNFGDGTSSTNPNPVHVFRTGEFNVNLTVQDTAGCSNSVTNIQKFGNIGPDCRTSITSNSTSTLTATFTHSTLGQAPYSFLWNFGDGNTSTSAIPSHSFITQGRYGVSLRVIDAAHDTAFANLNYLTPSSSTCTTNYILTGVYGLPNPSAFSNVIISYTDPNGTVYSSNDFAQPPQSCFKIIKAEDYHTNEQGQKTKKLTIEFTCRVFSGSSSLLIENAKAQVVVAYK